MAITAWGGGCQDAAEVAATVLEEHLAITGAGIILTREWAAVDAIARSILLTPSCSLNTRDVAWFSLDAAILAIQAGYGASELLVALIKDVTSVAVAAALNVPVDSPVAV